MSTLTDVCGSAVAFSYRSFDRVILNGYVPRLQTPGGVAVFFRDVQHKPILAGKVFKDLTERFVGQVKRFAEQRRIPMLPVTGKQRPGEVAQAALRRAERDGRFGVVAIIVHQEMARVFASRHGGGRATNFRVIEDRRLVNHYYFYFRDREYGDGFVRICSYPPFSTRIWMNAHGYIQAQLRRRRVRFEAVDNCLVSASDPRAVQEAADEFTAARVEQIARKWLAMVPAPLLPEERAAGYETSLSMYQVEYCDNVIFEQTRVLNRVFEQILRDHLHLGRLDMVKVLFDRRPNKRTKTRCATRVLREGAVACLKVFYKKSFLKQYNKAGRLLRTEVCINDPTDVGVRKSLVHLDYLRRIADHTLTRFQKAQAVAYASAWDRSTFERLTTPSVMGGQRVAALRFGAPRTMQLLAALACAGLSLCAFSQGQLRTVLVERFGVPPDEVRPTQLSYQLRKFRGHGLLRKVPGKNLYTLTDLGYRVAIGLTKLHERLLAPLLHSFDDAVRHSLTEATHDMDHLLSRINQDFDQFAQLTTKATTAT